MEKGTTDSLLYIPFNPDRPPEHKTFDLAQDLGMSQNVAQLATHEKRIKDLGGVVFFLATRKRIGRPFSPFFFANGRSSVSSFPRGTLDGSHVIQNGD